MADPETVQVATRHPTEDPPPRKAVVGGSVSDAEKERILAAVEQAGFKGQSEGVRAVMLSFVESAEVRDAVARALRTTRAA